jgi:hypothetical protein
MGRVIGPAPFESLGIEDRISPEWSDFRDEETPR